MVEILEKFWYFYLEQEFAYRFVTGLITGLIFISFALFIFIMISRTVKNRREMLTAKYSNEFEELLTDFLFGDHHDRESTEYKSLISLLRSKVKTKTQHDAFIKVMMELHKNLHGESAQSLEFLYQDTGIENKAIKNIKSGRWFKKAFAFMELSQFNVQKSGDLIMNYTDNTNKILRDEAQFALIRLWGIRGLKFVPKTLTLMSDWQQVRILEQLKKMHRDDIPSFIPWLSNKNPSVITFALKLVTYFNQVDAENEIVSLFDHEDVKIQKYALYAIGKLQLENSVLKIIEHYDRFDDQDTKITAVNTLYQLLVPISKDFFFTRLKEDIYEVVMTSAKAIHDMGFRKELVYESSHLNNFNRRVVIHALDERCCNGVALLRNVRLLCHYYGGIHDLGICIF
jgi:hypothetical protein